jgi:DNA repair photolyase
MSERSGPRGRGASGNPPSRFPRIEIETEVPPPGRVATQFLRDDSRSALTFNESPDVPFDAGLNPYRGCEHGCVYCYARPTHEYLGFSAGLDFESRILVKEDIAELLERELSKPSWKPQAIGLSGVTDPYQPIERKLGLTRACLEVLARFRNPVAIITKNALVERDADLLAEMAELDTAAVFVSITTLDAALARRMEPRTSHPQRRVEAIARLTEKGIKCGVMVAPVVPGVTDHEIPAILEAAAGAGARWARYIPLRLPGAVAGLFESWLEEHYPERRAKVLSRIRSIRGGRLNDPSFGSRMTGEGPFAEQIAALFESSRRRLEFSSGRTDLATEHFRRPSGSQMDLFSTAKRAR